MAGEDENKEIETQETEVEETETEEEQDQETNETDESTEDSEEEELELDDPFANVPKFNNDEGDYEDVETDPVEIYRKGLEDAQKMFNEKQTQIKSEKAKGEDVSGEDNDKLRSLYTKVQQLENELTQAKETQKQAQQSRTSAQNSAAARAVQHSYERGLERTLSKAGLEYSPEIYGNLNNMIATVEVQLGRPLNGAETREVTEFHYQNLQPWIKENANKEISLPDKPPTNLGGAGKSQPAKKETKTKSSELDVLQQDTVSKLKKGEITTDDVWALMAKVAPQ